MSVPTHSSAPSDADIPRVVAWTDGCCLGNPGPGGYGAVLLSGGNRKELRGGYKRTTNNRMEILAVIRALEALKERCDVTICTDSQYVVNAMTKGWAENWKSRGWKTAGNQAAANPDLWEQMLRLRLKHRVTFQWVKGHSGVAENERADRLANEGATGPDLLVDTEYKG
jgi:ribonuclease HI